MPTVSQNVYSRISHSSTGALETTRAGLPLHSALHFIRITHVYSTQLLRRTSPPSCHTHILRPRGTSSLLRQRSQTKKLTWRLCSQVPHDDAYHSSERAAIRGDELGSSTRVLIDEDEPSTPLPNPGCLQEVPTVDSSLVGNLDEISDLNLFGDSSHEGTSQSSPLPRTRVRLSDGLSYPTEPPPTYSVLSPPLPTGSTLRTVAYYDPNISASVDSTSLSTTGTDRHRHYHGLYAPRAGSPLRRVTTVRYTDSEGHADDETSTSEEASFTYYGQEAAISAAASIFEDFPPHNDLDVPVSLFISNSASSVTLPAVSPLQWRDFIVPPELAAPCARPDV